MSQLITTVIADDEPIARQHIKNLLAKESDIDLIAECQDGREALRVIREQKPELLFLDIQMPYLDGLETLCRLEGEYRPVVVFVTAYDEFAVAAFEVDATDYLMKPFTNVRFKSSLQRAREQVLVRRSEHSTYSAAETPTATDARRAPLVRLLVKQAGRIGFVQLADVEWIEAAGNYVALHYSGKTHLMRESLQGILERIDQSRFMRVHRTAIVNLSMIGSIKPGSDSEYKAILKNGIEIPLSRRRYQEVLKALERST